MKGALYMLWDNAFANYALAGALTYPRVIHPVTDSSQTYISQTGT